MLSIASFYNSCNQREKIVFRFLLNAYFRFKEELYVTQLKIYLTDHVIKRDFVVSKTEENSNNMTVNYNIMQVL